MPSPFPGMDPYLEGPQWTSVHAALSVEIARQLSPLLSERYVARPNERLVVAMPTSDDDATIMPDFIPHITVEITHTDSRRLVTAIEVLSPTNKRGEGRAEYVEKCGRTLRSAVHLVEIDLLRSGQRIPTREPLPASAYFIFVGRAEMRPTTETWPVRLNETLPTIPIPLLAEDGEVPLDLQRALASVYETFRYDRTLDYTQPPTIPFRSDEETAWAHERISAWRAARSKPTPMRTG